MQTMATCLPVDLKLFSSLLLAGVGLILVMRAVTVKGTPWLTGRTVTLPTTANASCKPRCKEPAIFSGKTEDFKEWMFTLQEAIAILQPQDPVGYAASFMEGSARQWVMALWQDNRRSSTWQQFQKQMYDAFAFEHQEEYERQCLVRTRQSGGLEDYIHTFSSRCLAARSMDDLTKTVLFTEGLVGGEVAREVQRFHPRTLSEAIRAARTAAQSKRSGDYATGNGELRQMRSIHLANVCPRLSENAFLEKADVFAARKLDIWLVSALSVYVTQT